MLESRQFVIKTDHKPLIYTFAKKAEKASPRQLRQLSYISQFSTEIIYIKGIVDDSLFRINEITMPIALSAQLIHEEQEQDDELKQLLVDSDSSLKLQRLSIDNETAIFCDTSSGYIQPYLPKSLRCRAFNSVHGLTHPGTRVTCRQLKQKYIWPGINKDALRWTRSCIACQRAKIQRHNKLAPQQIDVPDSTLARFNHIHLDLIELPTVDTSDIKGLRYCLTLIDRFSRWPIR